MDTKDIEYCRYCNNWECRCSDCPCLVEGEQGQWFCDEQQKDCKDVTECHEYDEDSTCYEGEDFE